MATLVAVHGAMHGAWAWSPLRRLLAAEGHDLVAPTLSGQGERAAELTSDGGRQIGAANHVEDVLEACFLEDVRDAVLVLHSYSGVLAGPLAERGRQHFRQIVLMGAFHVRPGQSLLDVEPPETAERYRRLAGEHGDGFRVPASDAFLTQWGVETSELADFIGPRLTDFPLKAATDPIDYDPATLHEIARTYIEHTSPPLESLARSLEAALADGFEHRAIASGHEMMLVDPAETMRLLLSIATS